MSVTAPSAIWLADIDTTAFEHSNHIKKIAELTQAKFPLAPGFVITEHAYFQFLKENKLDHKIQQMLSTIAVDRPDSLMQGENHIAKLFEEAAIQDALTDKLLGFYDALDSNLTLQLHATGKHQAKHFNATAYTDKEFIEQIKQAWATMFSSQALWHRHHQDVDHMQTGAIILVQAALPQEKSGKVFTVEKKTNAKDKMTILNGTDHYVLSKKNLTIIERELRHQTNDTKLSHEEILDIAYLAQKLEQHLYFPQEISWTFVDDELYIIETKPVSTLSETPVAKTKKIPAARGTRVTPTIGTGVIKIVKTNTDLNAINSQHIVVLSEVKPQHFSKLKKAKGIISESGRPHTEIATLLRRHGIPAIFNVKDATKQFKNGHLITIHGDKAEIYNGGF